MNLKRVKDLGQGPAFVSLVLARVDPEVEPALTEEVNEYLQCLMRRNDLVFRSAPHRDTTLSPFPVILLTGRSDTDR
jgi:hypothetical protein